MTRLRGRIVTLATAYSAAVALLLVACIPDRAANLRKVEEYEARQAELAAAGLVEPSVGGTLDVGTVYLTLSAMSWNPADWAWKANHDTGMFYEQLFAADLDQSVTKGGSHPFRADAWLPSDAIRGELAETWYWEDELTLVVEIRRGVRIPAKEGVTEARDLDAYDVVASFERIDRSPKKTSGYFDHVASVTARDDLTVVFAFSSFTSDWAYRFGYGYYSSIAPREIDQVDAGDWRNAVGSGPFQLVDYVAANVQHYRRTPNYWDRERPAGASRSYPIPFVDEVRYRIFKDPGTAYTALRTGKVDMLEIMPWLVVDHLKETTPELRWDRRLHDAGVFVALRVDQEPFDDVRVRRALNYAVDKRELLERLYGGHGELFGFPMHPDWGAYFQPLEEMPAAVQDLYRFQPDRARRLLEEAGFGDGFEFAMQVCACNPSHLDLSQVIADHLSRVGVTVRIEPLEYAAFLSTMTTGNHGPGYLMENGHTNPTTSLRKNFTSGQLWNPSRWSDPDFDRAIEEVLGTRDEAERIGRLQQLTAQVVAEAPYLFLPAPYVYAAWWPWVRNYGGELRGGAVRPAPIYSRIWIDHQLKAELGFAGDSR